MYQKNKQGNPSSASYKVLITTNKKRIITSLSVVQSNETDGAIEALRLVKTQKRLQVFQ